MRFGDLGRIVLFCLCIASAAVAQPAGVVRDVDGKPIGGAKVMLYSHRTECGLDNDVIETVQSAANGSYHFTKKLQFDVPSGTTDNNYYIVTALHPDHAIGWAVIVASDQQPTYDLVLTRPAQQAVVVKDAEGIPVAGATLWVALAGEESNAEPSLRSYLHLPTDIHLASAQTNAEGRATLTNLPITRLTLRAAHKGSAAAWKRVEMPADKEVEIKLSPAGVVRGTVRNEDGEAVADAIVAFAGNGRTTLVRTNSDGQFEADDLAGVGAASSGDGGDGKYTISIRHPDFCSALSTLTLNPGQTIDGFDISVEKGSLLRVTVTDPETHDPVAGVHLQTQVNDRRLDGFTNQKGQIEWRTLPGKGSAFMVSPPIGTYIVGDLPSVPITVAGDETEATLEPPTPFKPTVAIRGHVSDSEGKPAKGAIVRVMCAERHVLTGGQSGFSAEVVTTEDGSYTVRGFPSSTHLCAYVETRDRKFAGVGEFDVPAVGGDLSAPIKLTATQAADVDLHQLSGAAQPDRKMMIAPIVGGQKMPRSTRSVTADAQSHLKLDGILPGVTYSIEDARLRESNGRRPTENLMRENVQIIPAP